MAALFCCQLLTHDPLRLELALHLEELLTQLVVLAEKLLTIFHLQRQFLIHVASINSLAALRLLRNFDG